MSENSAGSGTAKRLEDLIADTQSCIRALDRRLRNLEEASRLAAEQAPTGQVPVRRIGSSPCWRSSAIDRPDPGRAKGPQLSDLSQGVHEERATAASAGRRLVLENP